MDFVSTRKAPEAIGPYSQAVVAGELVFTAGQIALDPASMEMEGDDVAAQTDRVLRNLGAVLAEAGCGFSDVVKTTVYLADMADFPVMNEVYARHFGDHRPARAAIQAAALPKGGLVEIDAIAVRS
jgi:2-iminobutanoate/2-iminopropanoate deaminase